jgi:hypothetical protein
MIYPVKFIWKFQCKTCGAWTILDKIGLQEQTPELGCDVIHVFDHNCIPRTKNAVRLSGYTDDGGYILLCASCGDITSIKTTNQLNWDTITIIPDLADHSPNKQENVADGIHKDFIAALKDSHHA